MIKGHGDDLYAYGGKIKYNFSSNILSEVNHNGLIRYLADNCAKYLDRYPEPEPWSLESRLAGRLGVGNGSVMVTNGATEAIYILAHAFQGCHSAIVTPTFSEYEDACRMYCHKMSFVKSLEELPEDVDIVWLCNPNNPTGSVYPYDKLLEKISIRKGTIFIIDQSYSDYTDCKLLDAESTLEFANIIILGSFTKRFSVPGLRVGYMVGSDKIMDNVRRFRMPWAVSGPAIAGAEYLMNHDADYKIDVRMLHNEALVVAAEFRDTGISVEPTDCNFMLCRLPHGTAAELKEYLVMNYGILIRDASNFRGLDEKYFRIAVQDQDTNDKLISAVRKWMSL